MFIFQVGKQAFSGSQGAGKTLSTREMLLKLDQLYTNTRVSYEALERQYSGCNTKLKYFLNEDTLERLSVLVPGLKARPSKKADAIRKAGAEYYASFKLFEKKYNLLKDALYSNNSQGIRDAMAGISRAYFDLAVSQEKFAPLVEDYNVSGIGYARSAFDILLETAMAAGILTGIGSAASLTRAGLAAAVGAFMATGGRAAAKNALFGAAFFTALGIPSDYYSFSKISAAMKRVGTDQAGALDALSAALKEFRAAAGIGDDSQFGALVGSVDAARAEIRQKLRADPSYKIDPERILAYFNESLVQMAVFEMGFGFFRSAKAQGKPKIFEQKISKVEAKPKPVEARAEAWPVVKAILSKSQLSAIAKIDAGIEAQVSQLKAGAAIAGTGAAAAQKELDALLLLKSLFSAEREAYAAWSLGLKKKGKFSQAEADAYFGRMLDWERQQSGKRNVALMASKPAPANERLETEMKLLQPGVNKEALIKVMGEGVYCERLNDVNSRDFKEAYAMLRRYFPSDELDPAIDLVEMQFQNSRNFAKLCSRDFSKVAPDLSAPLYQRYYLIVAKDNEGKIIGVCDGNFIGTKKASAMYWAHVAVPEVERRRGIATLLYSSTLDLGNGMANAAEASFGKMGESVSYKTPIPGNKLNYFVLETEPVNQASQDAVALTWGRLLFHGSLGVSVVPKMRYAQIDLESSRGVKFLQSESGAVPLLLGFRKLGGEGEMSVAAGDIRNLSELMRIGFMSTGLCSPKAAWIDYRHSVQDFKGMPSSARVPVVRLPSSPGVAGVEELAGKVIPAVGTMEERYLLYQEYPWYTAKDGYNNLISTARENGTYVPLEAAKQFMLEKARKKESTVPPSN